MFVMSTQLLSLVMANYSPRLAVLAELQSSSGNTNLEGELARWENHPLPPLHLLSQEMGNIVPQEAKLDKCSSGNWRQDECDFKPLCAVSPSVESLFRQPVHFSRFLKRPCMFGNGKQDN